MRFTNVFKAFDPTFPPNVPRLATITPDGWMDGRTDGWIDGWMEQWMDIGVCISQHVRIYTGRVTTLTRSIPGLVVSVMGSAQDGWMDGAMDLYRGTYMYKPRCTKTYSQ